MQTTPPEGAAEGGQARERTSSVRASTRGDDVGAVGEGDPGAGAGPHASPRGPITVPTVKLVHPLVADLMRARPAVYYADLLASAAVAWASLLGGAAAHGPTAAALFAVAVVALYRAASFIHELTHLRPGAIPGFQLVWNALVGVPLLLPSMLYVGVHTVHHAQRNYGTVRDPEYLPVGRWPAWKVVLWTAHAALLPVALLLRFAVLAPLSLLHPGLRSLVWRKASALSINPAFERGPAPAAQRRAFALQEFACSLWAIALLVLVVTGAVPMRLFLFGVGAAGAVGFLNQLRTAVAHRFRNEGPELSFEEQLADSVNVPGNPVLTPLWAPVGLRFHALHHLLPGLPYHALGEAHRRIARALPPGSTYHRACERSLGSAWGALLMAATDRVDPDRFPPAMS